MKNVRLVSHWRFAAAAAAHARAQEEHPHSHGDAEQFGTVHFPASCRRRGPPTFTRAVAQLHSFGYEESRLSFEEVVRADPGVRHRVLGDRDDLLPPDLGAAGREELAAGQPPPRRPPSSAARPSARRHSSPRSAPSTATPRRRSHGPRAQAYGRAMEELRAPIPDDHEVAIFYALSLLGTAPPLGHDVRAPEEGGRDPEPSPPARARHPGIAHYMIHSFDYPELAEEALPAARAYAKIAPSSPHALHMPSHIFTRLGLWQESIDSNLASAETGRHWSRSGSRAPRRSTRSTPSTISSTRTCRSETIRALGEVLGGDGDAARSTRPNSRRATRSRRFPLAGRSSGGTGRPRRSSGLRRRAAVGPVPLRAGDHAVRAGPRSGALRATGRRARAVAKLTEIQAASRSPRCRAHTTGRRRSNPYASPPRPGSRTPEGRKDEALAWRARPPSSTRRPASTP